MSSQYGREGGGGRAVSGVSEKRFGVRGVSARLP